jgi:hypothetical protein
MPLPEPVPGGDVDRLFEVVNVAEAQRRLMLGWLVATFTECIAHPIVTFRGEQGSAKTTTARTITTLIDPTAAPLGSPPKDDDRWDASCSAHYVVSVDNASKVSDWWSDSMCRGVTGAGTEKRQLYTDGDIYVTSYRRCIILNGISLSGMLRTDLLERSMAFDLRRPAHRLTDAEINDLLSEILPEVLGGLLDLTVEVSAIEVPRPDLPWMADFGLILAKLDAVFGDGPSAVVAYQDQLDELFEESLESDLIAKTIIELMDNRGGRTWEGPTADLLQELCGMRISDHLDARTAWWPDNATQLGHALTRSAPLLRSHSIEIDSIKVGPSSARKRGKRIRQTTTTASSDDGEATDDLVGDLPGVDRVDGVDGLYSTLRFREGEGGRRREHKKETSVHNVQLVHYNGTRCPRCEQNTYDAVEDQCRAVACYPRPRAPGPEPITPAQPWPSSDSDT